MVVTRIRARGETTKCTHVCARRGGSDRRTFDRCSSSRREVGQRANSRRHRWWRRRRRNRHRVRVIGFQHHGHVFVSDVFADEVVDHRPRRHINDVGHERRVDDRIDACRQLRVRRRWR